jgi:hypothetical protein
MPHASSSPNPQNRSRDPERVEVVVDLESRLALPMGEDRPYRGRRSGRSGDGPERLACRLPQVYDRFAGPGGWAHALRSIDFSA